MILIIDGEVFLLREKKSLEYDEDYSNATVQKDGTTWTPSIKMK